MDLGILKAIRDAEEDYISEIFEEMAGSEIDEFILDMYSDELD